MFPFIVIAVCIGTALWLSSVAMKNWKGDRFLCDDCVFNDPDLCKKPERPKALDCMAYQQKVDQKE